MLTVRWAFAGDWTWQEKVSAAVALAAYVEGDGRAWQHWLAGARAKGIAWAVNPDDVAGLQ